MTLRALVLAAPVLALAIPAGAQDLIALDRRLDRLEREVRDLRGAPEAVTAPGALSRLDAIEAEVRRLTGTVERLQNRVDRLAEDAARRLYDIQFRLTELEGGDLAALPAEPTPLGAVDVPEGGAAVSVSERQALERAVGLVQRGQVEEAEAALDGFFDAYPGSPLVPNAYYWQGEAAFARGDFRVAARNYLDGFQADPDGERAADSLMRLGVSLGRLGRTADACDTLAEVGRRFPAEDRAISEATGEAARLGCS